MHSHKKSSGERKMHWFGQGPGKERWFDSGTLDKLHQLRCFASVFDDMTMRLSLSAYANTNDIKQVEESAVLLIKEWEEVQMLLMREYSSYHLQIEDEDQIRCCTFALGRPCANTHAAEICEKCSPCFTVFQSEYRSWYIELRDQNILKMTTQMK